ncbi:hypothetical protein [Aurantimonas sp. 22II-16-19i]|uniref:hypothetical protein n=1 Tax=Aurantimonas sp. 22II-16-19i TaxID=1317114 RepID=UPI0009F7A5A2|nr:hypothetical protein [Aurantimonas sp. 22II-16-19i]ORE98977.1 hypothetical protein ATO4_01385 [Aurantimonas sp. 22II-16-19i]
MATLPPRPAAKASRLARLRRDTASNVGAGLSIFLTALVALAIFRSADLVSVTYDLPPGETSEAVIAAAEAWNGWMEAIGAAGVSQRATEIVEAFASGELFLPREPEGS